MIKLDRLVRSAGASLGESLNYYWPPTNLNAQALERNISLHMAHAFRAAGHLVYGEVNSAHPAGSTARFDLLAVDPATSGYTIAEFKRMDDMGQAQGFVADWNRIVGFVPQPAGAHRHQLLDLNQKWGVLAAITSNVEIARWFNTLNEDQGDPWTVGEENGPLDAAWADCWEALYTGNTLYLDAVPLADWHEVRHNQRASYWLVYVIAKLP
ncbi:MAG: hypothetical protein Q8Q09_18205 [Deltaproteobacteria bacterium]|nr:hypothetical protein [Deltaproteobacteria bacterium]